MSNPDIDRAVESDDTDALQRGLDLQNEGRLEDAATVYETLLSGPHELAATAHYLLALLLSDRGDTQGALAHFDGSVGLGAASPDLFFKRAELLRGLGRHQEALENYDRAIALQPQGKNFWNNRGVSQEALSRFEDAVDSYDYALMLDANYIQALHNRGSALLKLGQADRAIASFDEVLARNPNVPESWNFRAVALATLERYAEALDSSDKALALRANYPEAHNNRSIALRALKRPSQALEAAATALSLRPQFPEALNSMGSALAKLNRYDEACDVYRAALLGRPDDASIQLNLGMALEATGDLVGAQAAFAGAQTAAPTLPDAFFASGLAHIRAGRIREGFALYERRWTQKGGPRHDYPLDSLWLGEEPLGKRTLLVHAEQGFGDVIQFSRFVAMAAPASQLILQVQPPLKRLLASLQGVADVRAIAESEPAFDVHVPIMSLPLALGLELQHLAPKIPYLQPPPHLVDTWRQRLPAGHRPRIGLAWTGNPGHDNDHNRSMPLDGLRALLNEDAQFISLQKDYRPDDQAVLDQFPNLLRFETQLGDFADTAALISCCDVVIAVDTSVAHLAGALGKPLWLMLPRFCDWRWMNHREDSPWYPSATLVRQQQFGDWDDVAARIAARLRTLPLRTQDV